MSPGVMDRRLKTPRLRQSTWPQSGTAV